MIGKGRDGDRPVVVSIASSDIGKEDVNTIVAEVVFEILPAQIVRDSLYSASVATSLRRTISSRKRGDLVSTEKKRKEGRNASLTWCGMVFGFPWRTRPKYQHLGCQSHEET